MKEGKHIGSVASTHLPAPHRHVEGGSSADRRDIVALKRVVLELTALELAALELAALELAALELVALELVGAGPAASIPCARADPAP
jgi:hypothetical protein